MKTPIQIQESERIGLVNGEVARTRHILLTDTEWHQMMKMARDEDRSAAGLIRKLVLDYLEDMEIVLLHI